MYSLIPFFVLRTLEGTRNIATSALVYKDTYSNTTARVKSRAVRASKPPHIEHSNKEP